MKNVAVWMDLAGREASLSFFAAASGPGGQHVNKVATAVMLRWDLSLSQLPVSVRERLQTLAGRRLNAEGVLVLSSARFASQERNKADVWEKLQELLQAAAIRPKQRRATKPTRASREKRLQGKKKSAETKATRAKVRL